MKLNRPTLKIVIAVVVMLAALYWAFDSTRIRSYAGTNVTFVVGHGPVTVKNSSDQPIDVQLTSTGSRTFNVTSAVEGVAATSTKLGTGSSTTQLVEFALPPGGSEFTVVRAGSSSSDVSFAANPATRFEVTAQPLTQSETQTTVIATVVVILGALFFISRTTGHRWMSALPGRKPAVPVLVPAPEAVGDRGSALKSYGDNRTGSQ